MLKKIKSFLFENKTDKQTIIKNSLWIGMSEIILKLSQVVVTVLIARIFGTEIFGIYSYFGIIIAVLLIFSDIGVTQLLIRDYLHIRKEERKDYFFKGLYLKIFLSIIIVFIFFSYSYIYINDIVTFRIGLLLLIIGIENSFLDYIRGVFRGLKKSEIEFKIKFIQGIMYSSLIFIIIFTKSIIALLLFNILIYLLVLIYSYFQLYTKEFKKIKSISMDINYISIIKKGYIFALSGVLITLYYYIDTLMIKSFIGYEAVGIYNAAYKIILLVIMPIGIFSNSLFPVFSNLYKTNKNEYYKIVAYYSKIIFLFSLIIFPIIVYFAPDVLNILFGNQYINSGEVLQYLLVSVFFLYVNVVYAVGLQVSGKEKIFLLITLIATIFNGITNFVFIPEYGVIGAAYTTILTEMLITGLILIVFFKNKRDEKNN